MKLIAYAAEAILIALPPALRARSDERVLLETTVDPEPLANYRRDVAVIDTGRRAAIDAPAAAAATVGPVMVQYHQGPDLRRLSVVRDVVARASDRPRSPKCSPP